MRFTPSLEKLQPLILADTLRISVKVVLLIWPDKNSLASENLAKLCRVESDARNKTTKSMWNRIIKIQRDWAASDRKSVV